VLIIKGIDGKILYVSKLYEGKIADYQILKYDFPINQDWFKDKEVRIDLGFEGFPSDYPCKKIRKPHKKKWVAKGQSNDLTPEHIEYNKSDCRCEGIQRKS